MLSGNIQQSSLIVSLMDPLQLMNAARASWETSTRALLQEVDRLLHGEPFDEQLLQELKADLDGKRIAWEEASRALPASDRHRNT